ncbi:hypothetical protein ACFQ05_04935 [Amycolatopsis umgeniensis]|uniref:Uncharacterized protein n=1 Tax=Amycolatopsis umgeniensis TaxID=336628 RepID=A0A841B1M8_9PSEU|nr:hypothetical protein [Amycolatopsis umgeniensis]MBB5852615.1 hypothetical protein [Amycolatopsis umgeniensis]
MREMEEGLSVEPRAAKLAPLRGRMQRPFQKKALEKRSVAGESTLVERYIATAKMKNTQGPLRAYLLDQFAPSPEEAFGVLPGFVSVWPEPMLELADPVTIQGLRSPWYTYDYGSLGRGALADGECRHLAALIINADQSVSAALKDRLLNQPVTVEVYHGISEEQAAQMFVDLNYEGTRVDTITKANIDPRNKWIAAAKKIFDELGIKYATTGRQLTGTHQNLGEWILLTHAEQMVKAIVLGPNKALLKSKRAESWDGVDFERLHEAGVTWFREIFDHFGGHEVLVDKSRVVRTIAVRVALASLGSAFYRNDEAAIDAARTTLKEVNWVVSEAWQGIGGKVTVKDGVATMSAGSGKESITRAVQAVTKPETKAGEAVRGKLKGVD